MSRVVAKFADDTRLFRMVKTQAKKREEKDFKLGERQSKWQTISSASKCKLMLFGVKNHTIYTDGL